MTVEKSSNNKETQIIELLKGDPLRYACRLLSVNNMKNHSYSEVFNVTRKEVYDYVRKHGIPQNSSNSRNSLTDGFKFYEENGTWYCWFLERGICSNEEEFTKYDEGLIYITDMLLNISGTGLF